MNGNGGSMKTQISFHNIEKASQGGLEASILVLAKRHVERYLSRFEPDTVELHVHVEKSRHRDYFHVSMRLNVPGATLAAREEGRDPMAALRESFDEVERELLRQLARLRQEDAWRRKERREQLQRLKQAIDANPATGAKAFADLVRLLLPKLQQYVQREVAALRARGDLNPDEPAPQDIVDEVLARAYQRLGERPKNIDLLHWLYQLTHEVLKDETRKLPKDQPREHTVDERDRAVFASWQPKEMNLDELLVDEGSPEEIVGAEELRKRFHDALASMPSNWRRAIWLTQAEEIPLPKVAQMMGTSEQEVKRWIQLGDEYLRAQLREAGYTPGEEGKMLTYFVPRPADEVAELSSALDDLTPGAQPAQPAQPAKPAAPAAPAAPTGR
jgi:RNA polymerase sigma factor (sigma-70 family)